MTSKQIEILYSTCGIIKETSKGLSPALYDFIYNANNLAE